MQLTKELLEKVDKIYLLLLIEQLKQGVVSLKKAKNITRVFLTLTYSSVKDLKHKIKQFSLSYKEFGPLSEKLFFLIEEERTKKILDRIKSYV
jgi:hypothetical protein